ncbi:MAG: hypothetical protein NTU94_05445 [Planctomycetota bacterium]|nr:hypothetical protein [Planctomycetota bacterium]
MRSVVGVASVVLAAGLLLPAAATGEQEQWLAYRSAVESETVVGGTPGQTFELTEERPAGVRLPDFASARPLFAKWRTPAVPAGFLWVALDRTRDDRPYDRLFIDASADGSLADESAVAATDPRIYKDQQSAEFPLVKVLLPGPDGPVTYHLNLKVWISGTATRRIAARAAGWYEGTVRIGDKKHFCVLFDANANGAFDDCSEDPQLSDRIRIDAASRFAIGRVGKYISVEDRLYVLDVARDGASVTFSEPRGVALGVVRVPRGVDRFSVGGRNGLLVSRVENGAARLPVGTYRLNHWEIQRKDPTGAAWVLVAAMPSGAAALEVAALTPATLDVGEPVIASMSVKRLETGLWQFADPTLTGRAGESVSLTRNGEPVSAPQVAIRNADGTYDRRFDFALG